MTFGAGHVAGAALAASLTLGGALYDRLTDTLDKTAQTLQEVAKTVAVNQSEIQNLKEQRQ